MAISKTSISIEEFEDFIAQPENADRLFELVNGEIVEKMPTEEHGLLAGRLYGEIYIFLKTHPLGRVTIEVRHRAPDDNQNDRLPDVAFTSFERALPLVKKGAVPQMPDLVIEVKSPDDSTTKLREKALYYLKNGARLVWLVFPDRKEIEVYSENAVQTLGLADLLDGGDILPGFSLALKDIFAE
jgi:Uma2 family endonuclease